MSDPEHKPDHRGAVLDAEVRMLVDKLEQYGVLTEEALARQAGAERWSQGTFKAALRRGADEGAIVLLPDGFVALPDRRSD
jgi:hypothetical protein